MTQWFVKDLSKLTGVTVQTLHHYDRMNLLKPSLRLANGYRVYTEKDLLQLQQIIALKYFGFELVKIKHLLTEDSGAVEHFIAQAQLLEQKASKLMQASQTLKNIISAVDSRKSIPWETIIKVIEVYHMTQQIEHSWVKEIFTPQELTQYAAFEAEMKSASTEDKINFEENWAQLVTEIEENLEKDPCTAIGVALGKKCMDLINGVYGKTYAHLRTKKFEKGFGEGKGLQEVGLTPQTVSWLEKAMDSYWQERAYSLLAKVGHVTTPHLKSLWKEMMEDMYGEGESERKQEVVVNLLKDKQVSETAKEWLRANT